MGWLAFLLLTAVPGIPGGTVEADLDWLNRHREAALDTLMPLRPSGVSVAYRRYRDLYHDAPEEYFVIVGRLSPDSFEAEVVAPDGKSIQQQLLDLHIQNRRATFESLVKQVRLKKLRLGASKCAAAERQVRLLQGMRFTVPKLDTLFIHPVVHRVVVSFGAGDVDASIFDDDHPLVQWSMETLLQLRRCGETK